MEREKLVSFHSLALLNANGSLVLLIGEGAAGYTPQWLGILAISHLEIGYFEVQMRQSPLSTRVVWL